MLKKFFNFISVKGCSLKKDKIKNKYIAELNSSINKNSKKLVTKYKLIIITQNQTQVLIIIHDSYADIHRFSIIWRQINVKTMNTIKNSVTFHIKKLSNKHSPSTDVFAVNIKISCKYIKYFNIFTLGPINDTQILSGFLKSSAVKNCAE